MLPVLRNSFSRLDTKLDLSKKSLIAIHKDSYSDFLLSSSKDISIKGVFDSIFPVNDSYGYISIEFINYRMDEPQMDSLECKKKSLTYGADLYGTFRVIMFSTNSDTGLRSIKSIKEQEVFLCNIPLMTDVASFIINGIERIVICQIQKTPGVFFSRKINNNNQIDYTATIIPYRGSRIEFSFNAKGQLNFKIDKKKKLSIFHLLKCLELENNDIGSVFYESLEFKKETNELYSFSCNLKDYLGSFFTFDIINKNGEVIIEQDKTLTKGTIKKFKDIKIFYIKRNSLIGKYLYRDLKNKDFILKAPAILTEQDIDNIGSANIDAISIVDNNQKNFDSQILELFIKNIESDIETSLITIFRVLRPTDIYSIQGAKQHLENTFFNSNFYSLFNVGRYKMNQVLGLDIPEDHTLLTKLDIFTTIKKLIEMRKGLLQTEDIDHLGNRRIRTVGELVENQFRVGVSKMAKAALEKLDSLILDISTPKDFITTSFLSKSIKDFFMLSELSQFMEQNNCLSELVHGRKMSSLGHGGITRDRASFEIRDIHSSHYGRICPIETPDGQNIGLITSLACYAVINKYGFIETPYRRVQNGLISDDIEFLDAIKETKYKIGQITSSNVQDNKFCQDIIPSRFNGDYEMSNKNDIDYVDIAPKQMISVVASLVPFLESNDTARALMGCNMQRQAVPLLYPEAPRIGTGMEHTVIYQSGNAIIAKRSGTVLMVNAEIIIIQLDKNNLTEKKVDIYHLRRFDRTNQNTCINQKPIVKIGQKIAKGQLIADNYSTKNGELALGRDLLVAFMPWNGYNYEDSIVVSERVVQNEKFTSIHIEEFETVVRDTRLGPEEITRDIINVSDEELQYLDESGIIHIGTHVKGGDILIGKTTPKNETPVTSEEKLLRAIFGSKVTKSKDTSMRVPVGMQGTVCDVKILTRRGNIKDDRALQIERKEIKSRCKKKEYEIEATNSYFDEELNKLLKNSAINIKNKQDIVKFNDLKHLSLGEKFNLNIADKNILSEMSEMRNSYVSIIQKIEATFAKDIEKIMDGDELPNGVLKIVKVSIAVKSRIQAGDKVAGRHGNKGVVSTIVPVEDMPFMKDGTPIDLILSPIGVPGRMNIGQILETHLGLASFGIGRKIDKMLQEKEAIENVRSFIMDVMTDKVAKNQLSKMQDQDVMILANQYRNGMYFASSAFDGAKTEDIDYFLEKAGFDKSGQVILYDGKTGEPFHRKITVGYKYILKLHHLVDEKIHARSTGPYSLVTQQPLGGRANMGGQRLGEMECWALQAYGAAYTLQEMLTVKSDDVSGRKRVYESIINGEIKFYSGIPESFNVLCKEIKSLGLNINFGVK